MATFDTAAFKESLMKKGKKDPEWIRLEEDWEHYEDERNKVIREVNNLEKEKKEAKDDKKQEISRKIELKKVEKDLARIKRSKAAYQQQQRSHELEKDLLLTRLTTETNVELKRVLHEKFKEAEENIQYWKTWVKKYDSEAKSFEERLGQMIDKESKWLLDEAMQAGFVGVTIIICVILGQAGVGKTCVKYLLLDQQPPHLRSSTICAETPLRIEIKRMSAARIQSLKGNWKEIKGEEMIDIAAKMILLAEQDTSSSVNAEVTSEVATVKVLKKQSSVLTKIVNWITKRNRPTEGTSAASVRAEGRSANSDARATTKLQTSDACERAINKIMTKLIQCISKLKSEEGQLKHLADPITEQLLNSLWVYFSDCGGQPQYHELLPLFVHCISSALCVTCLTDKLDEVKAVEYYDEGKRIGVPQQSQLSARNTIQYLVNTIQSYSTQDKPPSIVMVGTHLDQLEEKMKQISRSEVRCNPPPGGGVQPYISDKIETLEEKNKQLLEMFEPEFSQQLILYPGHKKSLLFPVNALNPGERDKAVAQSMRCAVEKSGAREVKVPVWWYVLELLLQELAKELGRGVLSRAECLQMAHLLNIPEESFDAALVYFDELNVIKYSPKVLPDVVFVDSQIPLDKVSELVYHSYLLSQPKGEAVELSSSIPTTLEAQKEFTEYGVVSETLLDQFPRHYVPGIFTKDHLSKYLMNLLVFAEIPSPTWVRNTLKADQKYYVMLSLLVTLSEAELEKYRVSSPVAATLLVRFPSGSRRAGIFCCFVIHLIRHCGWDLLLKSKQPLYRNCVKLQLLTSPPCMITLIDYNIYIEVHVDITATVPRSEYAGHFPIIRQAILSGIQTACSTLKYKTTKPELAFFCPHFSPPLSFPPLPIISDNQSQEVKQHTATLTKDKKYWCCDLTPGLSGIVDEYYSIWFRQSQVSQDFAGSLNHLTPAPTTSDLSLLDTPPSLSKLSILRTARGKKIKIIERVAPFWQNLGALLDFDDTGSKLALIKAEYPSNPEACCRAIFQHWLNGNGVRPCTWRMLIELLDDCDQEVLSQEIQNAMLSTM